MSAKEYLTKISNFKKVFIAFEVSGLLIWGLGFFHVATRSSTKLAYVIVFLSTVIFGIALLVMTYQVACILKNEGIIAISPGLLVFYQFLANIFITSIIIPMIVPIIIWIKSNKLKLGEKKV